jgi:hypothetical protein
MNFFYLIGLVAFIILPLRAIIGIVSILVALKTLHLTNFLFDEVLIVPSIVASIVVTVTFSGFVMVFTLVAIMVVTIPSMVVVVGVGQN